MKFVVAHRRASCQRPQTYLVYLASGSTNFRSPIHWVITFRYKENLENIRVKLNLFLNYRLQREEEEAFASSQSSQGAQSLTFSKFEEKKTNEKTRKVTTVKKFFSASSRVGSKKGNFLILFFLLCPKRYRVDPQCMWAQLSNFCKRSENISTDLRCWVWSADDVWNLFGWRTLCFRELIYSIRGIKVIEICSFVYKIHSHPICLDVLFFVPLIFGYWFILLCLISSLSIPYQKWLFLALKLSKKEVFWELVRQPVC